MKFSSAIINWYQQNKRDLPWRNTKNPYLVWLSEIILQQTRVEQGLPYYINFSETYPTVLDLANAPSDDVMKLWQGLGYYSRARNLHATAKEIAEKYNQIFPNNYLELLTLKGIGDYSASAISSFCYNEVQPVLDGNVFRVLARYLAMENDISASSSKKIFKEAAFALIDKKKPGLFNQAIMEFGAMQCVPKNPNCEKCVLNNSCAAFATKKVNELPVKSKKVKTKKRYFNFLFIDENNFTYLQKREKNDIWQDLYQFPLIETDKEMEIAELLVLKEFKNILSTKSYQINNDTGYLKHILTHQILYCRFITISGKIGANQGKYQKIPIGQLRLFAFPKIVDKFYQKNILKSSIADY